ncbi:hypothetical protein ACJQWK_10690 [Exserohilum turcicum]
MKSTAGPHEQDTPEFANPVMEAHGVEKPGLSQRPRCVRRKPGLKQLGSPGGHGAMAAPRKYGHGRSNTWTNTQREAATLLHTSPSAPLLLQTIQQRHNAGEAGGDRARHGLQEQRELWESTLPHLSHDHVHPTGR